MADLTGATEPLGVTTPHTKEDINQDEEDDVKVTKLLQKEKNRQSAYFDIDKDLPKRRGYNLQERIRREISPSDSSTNDLLLVQHCMDQEFCPVVEIAMNQYNMKQGLKRFGQSGVRSIDKEVIQMVTMDALDPDDPKDPRREYHRSVMAYLMFLKEKQDGTINARGCCDRTIQMTYMTKEETISPTGMQESLMVTCIIDAMEGHDENVFNITRTFL